MSEHVVSKLADNDALRHQQKVYAEQVRLTYIPIWLSVAGTLAGAVLFVALQWTVISHNVLLSWLSVMTVLVCLHGYLGYRYFRTNPDTCKAGDWGRYYVISTVFAGLLWGSGAVLFFPEANFEQQITVAFAMLVISAGGVITLSHLRGAAYALIIPTMLPLLPLFFFEKTYIAIMMGLLLVAIFIFLLLSVYYLNASSFENISLRFAALENEQILIQAKQEVDKSSQEKSKFIANMSHELRTPMNVILGYAQILQQDKTLGIETQTNVKEIISAGHHLLELIKEVLDLSRIESGYIELKFEEVVLDEVIDECVSLIQPLADEQAITIYIRISENITVSTDRKRLKQVLINLLSNAVKYNRKQGRIDLTVSKLDEKYIRITVRDSGYGISEGRLHELFQPFNRLNAANKGIEGTGIGLTISRNLIERMGGEIGLESQLDVGTSFWIDLPLGELLYYR
ncbi:MAG: ATP-binding protein [Gammaproteobacteria bacterium]|nr:ATP-binding protein [Gammaproteobacteria bacterium]